MKIITKHRALFIIEIAILTAGFILLLNMSFSFIMQFIILGLLLAFYVVLGIFRHRMDHDIHGKVVLEYISISLIIALLFLIINIGRI